MWSDLTVVEVEGLDEVPGVAEGLPEVAGHEELPLGVFPVVNQEPAWRQEIVHVLLIMKTFVPSSSLSNSRCLGENCVL